MKFHNIGLITKIFTHEVLETLKTLIAFLQSKQLNVFLETKTAKHLTNTQLPVFSDDQLGSSCELLIIVGGDGSLLSAARIAVAHNTPVVGINRGRLGFLTDIKPNQIQEKITAILEGNYHEENRFFLEARIACKDAPKKHCIALNEISLTQGNCTKMIEFEVYIDDKFVCTERSDGMIISTPTGSTAYALSGGGPILHPTLNAIVLVPIFSHTLSSRPIVIDGDKCIKIVISENTPGNPRISCDSQNYFNISPCGSVSINKFSKYLRLLHPMDYDYFETLRSKLGWGRKLPEPE